jgi:tellurite resistance protein
LIHTQVAYDTIEEIIMSIGALSTADKTKLQNLINEGVQVHIDVNTLKEGLKETIESVAEELDIKKNVLNKAIAIAYKRSQNKDKLTESREELDEVEQVLMAAGKA